jgi:three-Cys-motif partner protein
MDASRNILWNNPEKVTAAQKERMNTFWGDESWEKAGYVIQPGLFGDITEKTSNKDIIDAYRKRLVEVAGFKYVPEPIPMKNEQGLVLYYLFFASNNSTGAKIARAIFKKFRT